MGLHRWYKGQLVFFRCLNPAVGEVVRQSDNYEWVEVRWLHSKRVSRYSKKDIQPINGVLNYWLAKDTGNDMVNATLPNSDLVDVLSKNSAGEKP